MPKKIIFLCYINLVMPVFVLNNNSTAKEFDIFFCLIIVFKKK